MDNLFHFRYRSADNGFCRVYYTRPTNPHVLYCLQDDGRAGVSRIVLYRCSSDGEPEYEVKIPDAADFEDPPGDTSIEKIVREFILKGNQNV